MRSWLRWVMDVVRTFDWLVVIVMGVSRLAGRVFPVESGEAAGDDSAQGDGRPSAQASGWSPTRRLSTATTVPTWLSLDESAARGTRSWECKD